MWEKQTSAAAAFLGGEASDSESQMRLTCVRRCIQTLEVDAEAESTEEGDAPTEQHRHHVEVDLIDQVEPQALPRKTRSQP
jgi:hypothetical protein